MVRQDTSSAVPGPENEARWYAVCTAPRHEKRVNELMSERCIETYLPLYKAERHWKKRTPVTLELPLFPSYIFARIPYTSRGRVLSTPGVLSLVGNGRHAVSISDFEIEALRNGLQHYGAEPHPYFAIGEKVSIKAGPLAGFSGTLLRLKTRTRVVIAIDAIMQGVAVEIDLNDLDTESAIDYSSDPLENVLAM